MKISCFDDLISEAKKMERKTVLAVVEAQEENTLRSVVAAANDGIVTPMLIGSVEKIRELLAKLVDNPEKFDIIQSDSVAESIKLAVEMIHSGRATAIMKGNLESGDYLKAIVNKETGLLDAGMMLSLSGLFTLPGYHKVFAVSDVALNTYPDLQGKKVIIQNAVKMLRALGIETPKVAVLAAVEKLNPKMPETVDADALKTMNQTGEITGCIVEGPISFDLATSPESVKIKNYSSPVAGDADLLIVPDLSAGNILAKSLTGMAGAQTAGIVLGAKVPVVLTSRSAEASDKYYSIALAACLSANI